MHPTEVDARNRFTSDAQRPGAGVETPAPDLRKPTLDAASAVRAGAAEMRDGAPRAIKSDEPRVSAATDAAADSASTVTSVLSRHPLTSIGLAAGAGVLVGRFILRSRK